MTRMRQCLLATVIVVTAAVLLPCPAVAADPPHPVMTWVKRHPLPDAKKPSPRLGYETSYGYDPLRRLLVRYGGHNQGGGGEQNSEVWTYDLDADVWTLKEPNDAPPGVCCAQENVYHDGLRKFVRFPAFSGSHGWQSFREIYLKNSSAWAYDLDSNTWRAMRPCPDVWPGPLRGAAYDADSDLIVLHGGEGVSHGTVAYDLYANAWHRLGPTGPKDGPPETSQPGFAYDAAHRVFVLFGSQFQKDPRTWAYDLRQNAWGVLETATHPRADKSCPVLAADTRNGVVLCSVIGDDGLETWALDVGKKAWTRLKVAGDLPKSGARNRVLIYLADRNEFVLENNTGGDGQPREQGVWTFRYADAPAPPARPRDLAVVTQHDAADLAWAAPDGGPPGGRYNVYRREGERPWQAEWKLVAEAVEGTHHKDAGLRREVAYQYQVRPVGAGGTEGPASYVARAQPPVTVGVVASVVGPDRVELDWPKAAGEDVVGYVVERAQVSVYSAEQAARVAERYKDASDSAVGAIEAVRQFERLTPEPTPANRFVDEGEGLFRQKPSRDAPPLIDRPLHKEQVVEGGRPYRYAVWAYRVRAVNRLGVAGGPSPLVFTYPSAVQDVSAKEEGKDQARLRWRASPERGLKGYVVYRHDGRYDKDPIVRLTPDPIAATEFLDPQAGAGSRRYEVVAVDALGQVGEPSQPVWSRREWQKFYLPYTGEWHQ